MRVTIITTPSKIGRIVAVSRQGTKRQRAKYRNAWAVMDFYGKTMVGHAYLANCYDERAMLKMARESRRMGYPSGAECDRVRCPSWHGVKGLVGLWTIFC